MTTVVDASVDARRLPSTVPCSRRLEIGEEATLVNDTIYCSQCAALLPGGWGIRHFRLSQGAVCGGGSPLD